MGDVEVELEDSFNTTGSYNDHSRAAQDSFNITSSFNSQTLNDNSVTAGVRQYNANFGGLSLGGLFGGGSGGGFAGKIGEYEVEENVVTVDARYLQLDQSVNQAISTGDGSGGFGSGSGGNVNQVFGQNASIAFGDGSVAGGRDVSIDNSTTSVNVGDVSWGNTTINTAFDNAFNDNSTNWDVEVEVEDSFNDQSQHTNVDVALNDSFQDNDSFTAEVDANFQDQSWTNSGQYFDQNATHGGEIDMDHFGM